MPIVPEQLGREGTKSQNTDERLQAPSRPSREMTTGAIYRIKFRLGVLTWHKRHFGATPGSGLFIGLRTSTHYGSHR